MAVAVITDSAAALDPLLLERHSIGVVPMLVTLGGRTYNDDEIDLEELVSRLDAGVRTAGPSPGAFQEAIDRHRGGQGTLVLTVSERMSSTHKAALVAAQANDDVRVVDTWTAAGAQALVVLAAAAAAERGASLDEVEATAVRVRALVRLVAAVDNLEYLVRGGRLPELAGKAGNHLGLRPLFEFRSGRIRPLRPALSRAGALEQLLGHWRRSHRSGARLHVGALHALNPEGADELLSAVRAELVPETAFVGTFGPVMVAHTGPGVTGLAWWWE